jgi:hypothetical protein
MAFPYVPLAKFKAFQSQRQVMTPFLRGQNWQTCVGLKGFSGYFFFLKQKKRNAILHALFVCHNLTINRPKKNTATQCQEISHPPKTKRELPKNSVSTPKSFTFVRYKL